MIMQLLGIPLFLLYKGPNLSELRKSRPLTKFSSTTTSMLGSRILLTLGMQMIRAIQSVHATGTIHRDIKPGNFCLGPTSASSVYIIDFGLCRRFLTAENTIRPARDKIGFRGTARYASIHAHNGYDLGLFNSSHTKVCEMIFGACFISLLKC
jgi:serine/threonine protein kinase